MNFSTGVASPNKEKVFEADDLVYPFHLLCVKRGLASMDLPLARTARLRNRFSVRFDLFYLV